MHVGSKGYVNAAKPSYGGGGPGQCSGGGSSDIRLVSCNFEYPDGLKSRIIVAAGSGSADGIFNKPTEADFGGSGGGLTGFSSQYSSSVGGNQTSGGSGEGVYKGRFGFGGGNGNNYVDNGANDGNGAGGGCYFGGSASQYVTYGGGAGGSSFISGHNGCVAIAKDFTEENPKFLESSIHFSGLSFYDTEMLDGS